MENYVVAELEIVALATADTITTSTPELDDNELYDQPLTVKVQVLDSWGSIAKVKYNGEKFEVPVMKDKDGSKYVLVNVIPDKGEAIINKG